jgi:signal peptidase II
MNGMAPRAGSSSSSADPEDRKLIVRRALLFFVLAAGGFTIDIATKTWVFDWLGPPHGRTEWIVEPYFGLQTALNRGALFGIGQGQVALFASLSCFAAVAILYWLFVAGGARDLLLTISLGSVMGGVAGNLYDRLGLWWTPDLVDVPQHAVRDWILFQYGNLVWPNFNVADMLLVCGAGLLVLHAWRVPAVNAPAQADPI